MLQISLFGIIKSICFQEEFYQLLEEAEGQVRGVQGIATNVPQYIIGKLGLNRDPLVELQNDLVKSLLILVMEN